MAGGIITPDDRYWAASSSAFYWVVETLETQVGSRQVAARLHEVSEHHLCGFGIDEFDQGEQEELVHLIVRLPDVARRDLPEYEGRNGLIGQIDELASMFTDAGE